ncbi:SGNH/GDSL hydrolase family protein [Amycolatopsis sp. NBC_00345]|uniref:SGNH/GDSL hydrolase family protein n=1 Tax=Amycolatopsis sp. NBC_00345 TaxID=2975955 RepID=UPI002E265DEC
MIEAGSTYVALGSSFAAGPGIPPVLDRTALRSGRNYAHLVAESLGLRLVDVTSSGATTAHLLRERQGRARPQIEAVGAETRLVTVTAGGNDLGYLGGLMAGSLRGLLARPVRVVSHRAADLLAGNGKPVSRASFDAVAASLAEVVVRVRDRAPSARVVLVDYLPVAGPDTRPGPGMPLTARAIEQARETADGLAGAFAEAARASGADLIAASSAGLDHCVGSAEPWVLGFRIGNPRSGGPVAYHPTAAGMAAVAAMVTGLLAD